ncbi:MAG: FtsX-like permease family protein [Spirochaetaceae bacterium]|nr:FtsX-like permease family protein [Spirochaetaceae bacterium]
MFSNLFVALRYLCGKNKGGGRYLLGAVGGIGLSLVPIMVTLIVADGMIRGITDRFIELGTGHLQVWYYPGGEQEKTGGGKNGSATEDTLRTIIGESEGVTGVWRQHEGLGVIVGNNGKTGVTIRAIEPSFWEDEGSRRYITTLEGDARIEADNEALLGEELAKITGAQTGKTVRLLTVRSDKDGRAIPRTTLFTVKGIISSGYHELDMMWCIISYEAGKRVLGANENDPFIVKIDDPYKKTAARAASLNWRLPDNYWVYRWNDILYSQYASYEQTRQLLLFIMLLIVVVAAVNVSSATSMLVIERQRDIAVFKAFGVRVRDVRSVFLWCGFLAGLFGSAAGISAGLFIGCFINQILRGLEAALNFFSAFSSGWTFHILDPSYYLQTIPIVIDWNTVALIGLFTVVCACVSSAFPARKAGRAKPVELLRKF